MARTTRERFKARRDNGWFFRFPADVLDSPRYCALSFKARALLLDMGAQFRGNNNGDLAAPWSWMKLRGWKSKDTLRRALLELLAAGMIENQNATPTIGAYCPDYRGGRSSYRPDHWGKVPRPSVLDRSFRPVLRPDHRAPSKNLPSIAGTDTMKRQPIPDDVQTALAAAGRAPGWNSRSPTIRRFDLGQCALYVVPARCWAYRRREQQMAARSREHGYG